MANRSDLPPNIVQVVAAHTRQYLEDPERAHLWDTSQIGGTGLVPTLLLTTRGRKSGEPRHAPVLYVAQEGGYLVIGSKGGSPTHPVWYLTLRENPDCEIRVGLLRTKARARVLAGAERERGWTAVTALHPAFLSYQARTERPIPVILLEPVAA